MEAPHNTTIKYHRIYPVTQSGARAIRLTTTIWHMEDAGGWKKTINEDLAGFIAERDSFYLDPASADG